MAAAGSMGTTGWPPPDPQSNVQRFGGPSPSEAEASPPRTHLWTSVAAVLFGVIGVVGAILPALDGQKVGDPDSTAFRAGVPMGLLGGLLAFALAITTLRRSAQSTTPRAAV